MHVEGNMSRGIRQVEYELGKYICLFFSKLASGRNPPNPAIWLVPRAGSSFTILPANPDGIVGSYIYRPLQVCLLFANEQNRWFLTIFLLKLALLLALAREKWILLFRQNIWRENQASQLGKPPKESKTGGSWCCFTSFITYAVSTAVLLI